MLHILDHCPDAYMVLIDSRSDQQVKQFFDSISHERIDKISLPINFGYNQSVNFYIKDFINDDNLPRSIIRLDADILFSVADFLSLTDAIDHLPTFSTIGMSYFDNDCNPERNVSKKLNFIKAVMVFHILLGILFLHLFQAVLWAFVVKF